MPGTVGGNFRSSIWAARALCSLSAVNSPDSRAELRAGTWPASAQACDFSEIQLRNTRDALALFSSAFFWTGSTNWCEPAHAAGVPPMLGRAATPQPMSVCLRSLICQMPFQLKAVLPFLRAM